MGGREHRPGEHERGDDGEGVEATAPRERPDRPEAVDVESGCVEEQDDSGDGGEEGRDRGSGEDEGGR